MPMKKVLLLIDCDSCRQLYVHSRVASEDTTAWELHGNNLIKMAVRDGWGESCCRNFQYCPSCLEDNEELELSVL
jgi:hypothetical protein